MRRGAALVFLLAAACATPTLDPSQLRVAEDRYGLYSGMGEGGRFVHVRTTTKVPCELNATFGSDIMLDYSVDRRMKLPLVAEWSSPEVQGFRAGRQRFPVDRIHAEPGGGEAEVQLVVVLDDERDLVEGEYERRFLDPGTERLYYRRVFVLEGCDTSPP